MPEPVEVIVKIEALSFSFPDGQPALDGINLTIRRGESVGLIGPNGAGKSTLLLHLNGVLRSNGHVRVFAMTTEPANLKEIRRRTGLVFQDPDDQLFSATVFDDVAFGPVNLGYSQDEVRRAVSRALGEVGLRGYEARSPHHLSLGEKKRVALATVLSMDPDILVLDEPTSNLDPAAQWNLTRLLRGLPVTKVIATHELGLVKELCRRVVVLDGGRIVADGPAAQILEDRPLLAAHGLLFGERA
ncbi:MAG: ABC transporter ATP-binding protein [Chloroflexi bacterium]|nr:ABC transporter ATP-binding protein [Chloroflexota bacterium]